jgi:hypothetical protein
VPCTRPSAKLVIIVTSALTTTRIIPAAGDSVEDHIELVAHGVNNLRELIERAAAAVELAVTHIFQAASPAVSAPVLSTSTGVSK